MALTGTLGFLAYGNMGAAILEGLLEKGAVIAGQALVYEVAAERVERARQHGIRVADSEAALAEQSDTLVIAVKPQMFDQATACMRDAIATKNPCVISIMAGISIAYMQRVLGPDARIVRVMPNLPAMVGAGAAAIAFSDSCTDSDRATARSIFEAVGVVEFVGESAMDAVTALSGSGPAYFFHMVECMAEAGAALGLSQEQATQLASQTLLGAALLLKQSDKSPGDLREQVTSKGGTTAAALEHLRQNGFPSLIAGAMKAAAQRSKELGK